MKPLSILQVISSEGFYGAESMVCTLGGALAQAGFRSTVAVFKDARAPHTEVADRAQQISLPVHLVPCTGRLDPQAVRTLRWVIRQSQADVVHAHGYKADLYSLAAARNEPVALVSTCHNWPDKRMLMRSYAALDRLALRFFDRVATPSREVARTLRKSGVRLGRINYIGNGIDVERFDGAVPTLRHHLPDPTRAIVGFVGRHVPDKGGEVLLNAARRIVDVFEAVTFVFVGEGESLAQWSALANELKLTDHVRFLGSCTDMPGIYASLDVLALPSLNEAMPMVVLEAMAAGTPVIASRVGAIPDLVSDDVTGILVAPGDARSLAASLLRLLHSPELAKTFGRRARDFVAQNHSAETMARSYLSLYESARGTTALKDCA